MIVLWSAVLVLAGGISGMDWAPQDPGDPTRGKPNRSSSACVDRLTAMRQEVGRGNSETIESRALQALARLEKEHPLEWDWLCRDSSGRIIEWLSGAADSGIERGMIERVLEKIGTNESVFHERFASLCHPVTPGGDPAWMQLYLDCCRRLRTSRLERIATICPQVIFTRHYNLGGSHYAYTEGLSDAQHERHFVGGASLCLMDLRATEPTIRTLVRDEDGVIRDPDVSWEGDRILFSWKKSDRQDDYHLYEFQMNSGTIKSLTSGLGFADYEPAYLPNGDIVFNSTRCVQTVDCWWTEVSNLYTCDADGRFMRRLTFDQVHDNYPTVLEDGRVIYTRWEYNDRGQIFIQSLFQMFPDGTGQTEFYGNNSWFPTSILHARGISGTQKILAIASGHHTTQAGKLILLDAARGRQEATGVQLIAPIRETEAVRVDAYGQDGNLFQYPYPLSETEYLAAFYPAGDYPPDGKYPDQRNFKIYWFDIDGNREMLASDPQTSSNQPIPLLPRTRPHRRPSSVDYGQTTGTYYMQDIYAGPGLKDVARGTIKSLRVVAMEFRCAGIGHTTNSGPGGDALASSPVAVGNGSWDVKRVLGTTKVYEDGSAYFRVPAQTPVYFQALDHRQHVVQTMRSWSTLQPGESFSCIGCHEHKNSAGAMGGKPTLAMRAGPAELEPSFSSEQTFSFRRQIQPILDRHCTRCHDGKTTTIYNLMGTDVEDPTGRRKWTQAYLTMTEATTMPGEGAIIYRGNDRGRLVNWVNTMSEPEMLPPYSAGAAKSELIALLDKGHYDVRLSDRENALLACWIDLAVPFCGDYTEANIWNEEEQQRYDSFLQKRKRMEQLEQQNIAQLVRPAAGMDWKPLQGGLPAASERIDGRTAVKMVCNFKGTTIDRAYWDRKISLDLTMCSGVEFYYRCTDPRPISYHTAYLRSGQGWYRIGFEADGTEGWQKIRLLKSTADIEGAPSGWGKVDQIRIAAWRGQDADTTMYITEPEPFGGSARIAIIRGDSGAARDSGEMRSVGQFSEIIAKFLDDLGLAYVVVSDMDVTADRLRPIPVVILPYNPNPSEKIVTELVRYLDNGGKMVACFSLAKPLADRLGLVLGQFVRQTAPGDFASIRPAEASILGMPKETRQASWNLYTAVPLAGKCRVAAWWYNREGTNTQKPAIVGSEKGFYISHVVLADDADNKRILLLSLLGDMRPDLWRLSAENAISQAGVIGSFSSFDQAASSILSANPQRKECADAVGLARSQYDKAKSSLDGSLYVAAITSAEQARKSLIQAYCLSQKPQADEFRAFWCHSAYGVEGMDWDAAVGKLAENGFTAVIPNMLWGGVAFYPSDVLPVSKMVQSRGDAMEQCVAACRKYRIQCHVWKVNFNMGWPTERSFMEQMKAAGRTQVGYDGKDNIEWLCPSNPANRKLELDSMVEVARKYPVDGIHFDYIRYPGQEHCFCEGCRKRFEKIVGQAMTVWPRVVRDDPDMAARWNRFRQDQITEVVRAVSEQARTIRPGLKISAAVFRNWPTDSIAMGQDWRLWCRKGYLDFVCPMDYTASNSQFERFVRSQIEWAEKVPCYPGIGLSTWNNPTDIVRLIEQINITRKLKTGGFTIFNYAANEAGQILPQLGIGISSSR